MLLTLLLTNLAAQARDYTFPGILPAGCTSPASDSNYSCGELTLADGDTITIITKPATINFSGAFTTGTGTMINLGGRAADLNIILNGVLTVGTGSNAAISIVTYSEVGYLYLAQGVYRDDEFMKVDSDNGDCISVASASSTSIDNNLSAILIDGQYGCHD